MRDFQWWQWTPAGSRPHVFLTLGPRLTELADAALAQLPRWHRDWDTLVRVVPPPVRHLTLAWLDTPTASTPSGSWDVLARALTDTAGGLDPVTLTCEQVASTPAGIVLSVRPTPALTMLSSLVVNTMREVYGPVSPIVPGGAPHIALAYGCRDVDTSPLRQHHRPVSETLTDLTLVDHDTFAAGGPRWDHRTQRSIRWR